MMTRTLRVQTVFLLLLALVVIAFEHSAPYSSGLDLKAIPISQSTALISSSPSVAVDADDNVIVAWVAEHPEGEAQIRYSISYDGEAFGPPNPLVSTTSLVRNPAVTGSPGVLFVAWEQGTREKSDVFLTVSYDSGSTFAEPVNLSRSQRASIEPSIAANQAGQVAVVWAERAGGGYKIALKVFDVTISLDQLPDLPVFFVSQSNLSARKPDVAIDDRGNIYIAWQEGSECSTIMFRQSTPFSNPMPLSQRTCNHDPRLALVPSDLVEVLLVWSEEGIHQRGEILFRRGYQVGLPFTPPAFSNPSNISNTPSGDSSHPDVAVLLVRNRIENIGIVWQEEVIGKPNPNSVIFFRTSLRPFDAPMVLTIDPSFPARSPRIAGDPTRNVLWIVWTQWNSGESSEIYALRSDLLPSN